jgi:molybdopterin-guanine dinucleotide biosynthesis protein
MNSGKSTALSCLVRGLSDAGLAVSAGKATGTGSGNDPGMFVDAGAVKVLDFTDFGYPTTFQLHHGHIRGLFVDLLSALTDSSPDVVVVEVADGVYQGETRALLADPVFQKAVDRVIFAAADALGAVAGLQVLKGANISVAAVTGVLTSSPLAVREAAAATDVPVLSTGSLCEPGVVLDLLSLPARESAAISS